MAAPQGMIRGVIIKLPHTRDVSGKSSIHGLKSSLISCFLTVKGYHVVLDLDSAVFSITGMTFLTRPNLIPSSPR